MDRLKNPQQSLEGKVERLSMYFEKMKLAEYVELLNNPLRLMWVNFLAGVARGVGTAIGLTLLGALILMSLKQLVLLNLPVISGFIAEIVRMVQDRIWY